MSITQTVEIPDNHRLVIDVPREVPAGRAEIVYFPAVGGERPLPGHTARTVEEALQIAAEKAANPNRKPISHYFGILSPETYGDGVAYQRAVRDE